MKIVKKKKEVIISPCHKEIIIFDVWINHTHPFACPCIIPTCPKCYQPCTGKVIKEIREIDCVS